MYQIIGVLNKLLSDVSLYLIIIINDSGNENNQYMVMCLA